LNGFEVEVSLVCQHRFYQKDGEDFGNPLFLGEKSRLQYFLGSTPVLSKKYFGTFTAVLQYFLRSTGKRRLYGYFCLKKAGVVS